MNSLILSSASMTSLEIASLVESQHGNVCTSIERLAKKGVIQLPPTQKVENKQSTSPNNKATAYVFSGEQGKRDSIIVVAQLSPEFTARLVDRWQELESGATRALSPAEVLLRQVQMMVDVEREQARQAEAQQRLEARQVETEQRLAQIESASDHFTIIGWCRFSNLHSVPLAEAAKMGKKATAFCKENNVAMGSVPDQRFGRANTYPKWVLDNLFAEPLDDAA